MKTFRKIMAIVPVLSLLVFVSGAFAQHEGMDRRDYFRSDQYQIAQSDVNPSTNFNKPDPREQPFSTRDSGSPYPKWKPKQTSPAYREGGYSERGRGQATEYQRGTTMDRGSTQEMRPEVSPYYGSQESTPTITTYESVVPPPTASDVRSESINRTHNPPLQRYIERGQGVPTPGGGSR